MTHPVVADCTSSEQTGELIDGITYGKGAAFVRQLVLRIGMDTFLDGLKTYFKKHKFKNTTVADFISAM